MKLPVMPPFVAPDALRLASPAFDSDVRHELGIALDGNLSHGFAIH